VASRAGPFAAAVGHLSAGGLLAFPTETVWGLGADARSSEAMARLRRWKGDRDGRPVSILVEGIEALARLGFELPPAGRVLAERFWPGPLTLVVPAPPAVAKGFARGVAGADGAVGLRCSSDPTAAGLARELARAGAGPITATSFNRHGDPPARSLAAARELGRQSPGPELLVPAEISGAAAGSCGAPSTVVECRGVLRVIREGAIPARALAQAGIAELETPNATTLATPTGEAVR